MDHAGANGGATGDRHLPAIVEAVRAIGISVRYGTVPDGPFLHGVLIDRGALLVDEDRLQFPGDVLHEAGHIAMLPPAERPQVIGTLPADGGQEMATLAWSYAMAIAFGLPLEVVFHDRFKAGGRWLRDAFSTGQCLGTPLLQCWGMTRIPGAPSHFDHLPLFPQMAKWLRDGDGW